MYCVERFLGKCLVWYVIPQFYSIPGDEMLYEAFQSGMYKTNVSSGLDIMIV